MNKKFKMTEQEFIDYCETLTEQELKRFQLESKKDDIEKAKNWFRVAFITIVLSCFSAEWAYFHAYSLVLTITCTIVYILSVCFAIGYSIRIKQEKLMYRMLEIYYKENNIL